MNWRRRWWKVSNIGCRWLHITIEPVMGNSEADGNVYPVAMKAGILRNGRAKS